MTCQEAANIRKPSTRVVSWGNHAITNGDTITIYYIFLFGCSRVIPNGKPTSDDILIQEI